jgi:hypothetical protein
MSRRASRGLYGNGEGSSHGQGNRRHHHVGGRLRRRSRRRAGVGLDRGGERLHYWVFGGPWTYDTDSDGEMAPEDAAWMEEAMAGLGAVIAGR